jgi:hypothetical protein
MMHPDLTAALARQQLAQLSADVDRLRARSHPSRTPLRVHVGRTLVRWGDRLARPASSPSILRRRPSVTMTG